MKFSISEILGHFFVRLVTELNRKNRTTKKHPKIKHQKSDYANTVYYSKSKVTAKI